MDLKSEIRECQKNIQSAYDYACQYGGKIFDLGDFLKLSDSTGSKVIIIRVDKINTEESPEDVTLYGPMLTVLYNNNVPITIDYLPKGCVHNAISGGTMDLSDDYVIETISTDSIAQIFNSFKIK